MLDVHLMEWGGQLLRWLHVITAIAWIGSSFYFMHLDASLRAVPDMPTGNGGVAWEVHGGGFYEVRKYLQAPAHLPEHLIWHKWESYSTWLSGFFLLIWVYYAQSELYLIDPAVRQLSPLTAATVGIGGLALGWVVYDLLCRSSIGKNDLALAAVGFAFIIAMAFGFQQVFSGRGAFIHTGALMATVMSGNVFLIIIPNQKKIIADLVAGRAPDPALGKQGKQRSTHNNYLTLPVVFLMLSNHSPLAWSNAYAYVIIGLVLVAGAVIRVFYNLRHAGRGDAWWTWALAALCLWLAFWISLSASPTGRERLGLAALPSEKTTVVTARAPDAVADIISGRCAMCHAREPSWPGIAIAPKGVRLDTPEAVWTQRHAIGIQGVATHAMPPGNISGITIDERRVVASWLRDINNMR
jgi:uncharacterized membrane protein